MNWNREPISIVANLPYNVATPLLINWLRMGTRINEMILMFQAEVADRITATPGNKSFGRLSVISNWCAETQLLFRIPARAFTPPPKVRFRCCAADTQCGKNAQDRSFVVGICKRCCVWPTPQDTPTIIVTVDVPVAELLQKSGIDGGRRAEELPR